MFFAYFEQPGGCDYTIGCGKQLRALSSVTKDEAIQEIHTMISEEFSPDSDRRLEGVHLIEGTMTYLDITSIYIKISAQKQREEVIRKEQSERELFEKLKQKFEK